jgi:hypothetical protein
MEDENDCYSLSDGEVTVWIEQEAIHIKAISRGSDPAELTKEQALELAAILKRLADKIAD